MQKCKKCKTTLSSKLILKSFWRGYEIFSCSNCKAEYEFNSKDRLIGGIIVGISTLFSGLIMSLFDLEIVSKVALVFLSMVFAGIVLSTLSIPFFKFQLKNK